MLTPSTGRRALPAEEAHARRPTGCTAAGRREVRVDIFSSPQLHVIVGISGRHAFALDGEKLGDGDGMGLLCYRRGE